MDQQRAVGLGAKQGLEDTIDLWVDSVTHAASLVIGVGSGKPGGASPLFAFLISPRPALTPVAAMVGASALGGQDARRPDAGKMPALPVLPLQFQPVWCGVSPHIS